MLCLQLCAFLATASLLQSDDAPEALSLPLLTKLLPSASAFQLAPRASKLPAKHAMPLLSPAAELPVTTVRTPARVQMCEKQLPGGGHPVFFYKPPTASESVREERPGPSSLRAGQPRMQSTDFYDEYLKTDPVTGEQTKMELDEKEKLYLDCLDAFYNEGGKQLLSDGEYDQLKLDLDFEGSITATYSQDEIKFVLANKRFSEGKPMLSDAEYDTLRGTLKKAGSLVVIHEGASCNIDTGICKSDLSIDKGKTRLLYLPGVVGSSLIISEVLYWTLHTDPFLGCFIGALPAYFVGTWFTENVFAQKPLVTQAACPECSDLITVYFGDLFGVMGEGSKITGDNVECKCTNQSCKAELTAKRGEMLLTTKISKLSPVPK